MKILIVEDSKALAERIKNLLTKLYVVDMVHSGKDALNQVDLVNYQAIILDLGLPDMHGLLVCKSLRARHVKVPILILTGIDDVESRVQLLDSGADDYLTKPFNSSELISRVAALLRRQSLPYVDDVIQVGDLEIDSNRRQVRRSGVLIPLRRKEFDILQYLVRNRGRAVSREMILNHAWESNKDSWNGTVDVHIKHLRDKIDRPFESAIIKTAYGIGYVVEGTQ